MGLLRTSEQGHDENGRGLRLLDAERCRSGGGEAVPCTGLFGSRFRREAYVTDDEKQELMRLAWKAGREATTTFQKERVEKALALAVLEGWDAESDDDIDFMYANIL